jgi:hypothetical protein
MQMKIWIATVVFSLCAATLAKSQEVFRTRHFNIKDRIALSGYDPVSYFAGTPLEGKESVTFTYEGITYRFANAANRAAFIAQPSRYEPAYGGWCAYAMGKTGDKVKIDPETFKIINGRLYLFYNFWGNNTLEDWNEDEVTLKGSADIQWKKYAAQ